MLTLPREPRHKYLTLLLEQIKYQLDEFYSVGVNNSEKTNYN